MAINTKALYESVTLTTPKAAERTMAASMARKKQRPGYRELSSDAICLKSPQIAPDRQCDDGELPECDIASSNDRSTSKKGMFAAAFKTLLLDAVSVLELFGIAPSKLAEDVAARKAFAVCIDGVDHYSTFLFTGKVRRKDIARVLRKLRGLEGWSMWHFFTSRRGSLGRVTPSTALARVDVDAVLKSATAFAER